MSKQKSDDYKFSAVKMYLKLNSLRQTCEYIGCSKSSLQRWVERYFENGSVKNKDYKKRNSRIKENHLEFIKKIIKDKPAITLHRLQNELLEKKNISISVPHLYYIVKYKLNITHKQLRQKYYPEKKLSSLKSDKKKFYQTIIDNGIKNIISIDETGFYLNMSKNFGRCSKGKRCYRTVHKYPYVKFNFICAIKYGKVIGYELYPKQNSGIDAVKFNDFYNRYIKNKYEDHLIILDNARFHKSPEVINNIKNSKNKVIFSLPYNPNLNPIENLFSQLKNHVRNESPIDYNSLKNEIKDIIETKISSTHLKNYFKYLFLQANEYMKK
jgi:transposase